MEKYYNITIIVNCNITSDLSLDKCKKIIDIFLLYYL